MNATEIVEHAGIDLSLAAESLRLTPEQRAIQHQIALDMALQLEAAQRAGLRRQQGDGTQQLIATPLRS